MHPDLIAMTLGSLPSVRLYRRRIVGVRYYTVVVDGTPGIDMRNFRSYKKAYDFYDRTTAYWAGVRRRERHPMDFPGTLFDHAATWR